MKGCWVQTASGRRVDLIGAEPDQIDLGDIVHHLGQINRYSGATGGGWTVAAHSVLVSLLLPASAKPGLRLAALLHDAHEAYMGDITSPVKAALRVLLNGADPVADIAAGLDDAIHRHFGLPFVLRPDWRSAIHLADMTALAIEKALLMAPEPEPWGVPLPPVPADAVNLWMHASEPGAFGKILRNSLRDVKKAGAK